MMNKKELRNEIRRRKREFTIEELRKLSFPKIEKLRQHPLIKSAKIILLYHSLPDEVYTHDFIKELASQGKIILLPYVIDNSLMEVRQYTSDVDLSLSKMSILEPIGKCFTEYDKIDVAVIPGISFDRQGNRLGRGKGYYDKFLSRLNNTYKIGLCYEFQKTDIVPTSCFDIKMDEIL